MSPATSRVHGSCYFIPRSHTENSYKSEVPHRAFTTARSSSQANSHPYVRKIRHSKRLYTGPFHSAAPPSPLQSLLCSASTP